MVRLKLVAPLAAIGMLIALVCPVQHASTQTTQGGTGTPTGVSIAEAEPPPGTETLAVQWVKVAAPNLGVMLAAVARPRCGALPDRRSPAWHSRLRPRIRTLGSGSGKRW
jgi:hypothetical protein